MADRDRNSGRSGGGRKGGADPSDDKDFGLGKRARGILGQLLSESPLDSLVERVGDIAVRNKAEDFGGSVAEGFIKISALRPILMALPAGVLQVVSQLLADYVMTKYAPDHDRPREWAKEFAQGFSRRIDEMQSGGPRAAAPAAGTAPAAPAGPREMSASEVLTKHPEIIAVLDRGRANPDPAVQALAAEVQADIHRHLNFAHEGVTLAAAPPLPPPPFATTLAGDAARQRVVAFVEANGPVAERPVVIAELEKKISSALQLTDLLAAMPAPVAPAVPPVDFTSVGDQLEWLRVAYSDPDELRDTLARLAPHAPHADRMAYLFSAPADAGLPAAVATSTAWSEFTTTVVGLAPDEAAALVAEAESRVATVAQAQGLTAPAVGTTTLTPDQLKQRILALPKRTVALTRQLFEQRLATLELVHPTQTPAAPALTWADFRARLAAFPERSAPLTLELLQSRMALVKDAKQSRVSAPLHAAIARITAVVGGPDQAIQALDQTANALGTLRNRLFGPLP